MSSLLEGLFGSELCSKYLNGFIAPGASLCFAMVNWFVLVTPYGDGVCACPLLGLFNQEIKPYKGALCKTGFAAAASLRS